MGEAQILSLNLISENGKKNCLGWPKRKGSIRHNKDIVDPDGGIGKVGMYFSIGALINNEFQEWGSG